VCTVQLRSTFGRQRAWGTLAVLTALPVLLPRSTLFPYTTLFRSEALPEAGADPAAVDEARKDRDTLGGRVEVRAHGVPPGLGSYARKEDRLDARLAAAVLGIQAVKGVEIGDGFALAALRGSEAHDEIGTDKRRTSNRAGGIEAGVSNGEEIVVRAAMKPLPTLMKP